jgi:hypothetical protein
MMDVMAVRTFAFDPTRSVLDIHASSSLHPIHTHAPVVGWLRLDITDGGAITGGAITGGAITGGAITGGAITGGAITGGAITGGSVDPSSPEGEVRFDLGGMRSGHPLVDREADRRLDVERFPTVVGTLRRLAPGEEADRFEVGGDLTFHGVTQALTGTVHLVMAADGSTLELDGETTIDVTDFGVRPPSLLVVKVHKDVRVVLRAVGEAT